MRNFIVLFLLALTSYVSVGQSNANWTLIHERTATWCPLCGGWGWTFKDQILNGFENDKVIFMAVHHSGDLMNQDAVTFGNNFGGSGQPIFFVDGVDIRVNNSNRDQKFQETQLEVEFKDFAEVLAGVEIQSTFDIFRNELNVEAEVEYLVNLSDTVNYYLGLYLLEDVMNSQSNRTGLQLHRNVLRKSILPNVFDNEIKIGGVQQGEKYQFQGKLENLSGDPENYKVLAVIWTKPDNKYLFFNANIAVPEIINTSSTQETMNSQFQAYQSESGDVVINLSHPVTEPGVVYMTDVSGKVLITKELTVNGMKDYVLSPAYIPGVHFITIQQGKQQKTEKIFLY